MIVNFTAMIYKQFYLAPGLILFPFFLAAQLFPKTNYPQGYFRNPLEIPISLAGNFGELRPGHYHMGMDIKTDARENLPVHAAADGFISRIKIEPAGFGRAIYIDHPNGLTTVYCHLNNFAPEIEAWLKRQQYKLESWKVMPDVPHDLFPVKKGDFIAYSGNTGGSEGPHLHFEIRRTSDDINQNPQLFGFNIPDHTKPNLLRLAVYDRHKSTYEQSPELVPVKRSGADFITAPGLLTISSDKVSFAVTAYDTHTGSSNLNGVYEGILYVDDQAITGFRMNNISYDNTRYMNAHIDYRTKTNGGPYLEHLSELPGYVNSIYTKVNGDGVIDISDGKIHGIRIEIKDAAGNTSVLRTQIKYIGSVVGEDTNHGVPVVGRTNYGATPVGVLSNRNKMFYPLMLDVYEDSDCEFYIGEKCLYDSVHIRYTAAASSNPAVISRVHTIGDVYIPLQDYFMVRIKPVASANKNRVVMQRFAGSKKDVQKVEWQGGWAAAKFRDFGNFQLMLDETAPEVVPIGFSNGSNLSKASRIAFTIKDNLEKFKNVRAELDGKWLRFTNDKGRNFIYVFDEMCSRGEHTLVITAEDEAGNKTEKAFRFIR
jgi:murein DD-endopeptidase MepM/ murein hydrolase activator NlpD